MYKNNPISTQTKISLLNSKYNSSILNFDFMVICSQDNAFMRTFGHCLGHHLARLA